MSISVGIIFEFFSFLPMKIVFLCRKSMVVTSDLRIRYLLAFFILHIHLRGIAFCLIDFD